MSDFKSKLPDFKEISSMASKLYKGVKSSIEEIVQDYKHKRTESKPEKAKTTTKAKKTEETTEKKSKE